MIATQFFFFFCKNQQYLYPLILEKKLNDAIWQNIWIDFILQVLMCPSLAISLKTKENIVYWLLNNSLIMILKYDSNNFALTKLKASPT